MEKRNTLISAGSLMGGILIGFTSAVLMFNETEEEKSQDIKDKLKEKINKITDMTVKSIGGVKNFKDEEIKELNIIQKQLEEVSEYIKKQLESHMEKA